MSAAEVIEQIKSLPPEERAAVIDFVAHLTEASGERVRLVKESSFRDASVKAFSRHAKLFKKLAE